MRSLLRRRRHHGATTTAHGSRGEGTSLAKGPALLVGTILVAFGLAGLLENSDFPSTSANFPDGTAEGSTLLGIEVNGWTSWGAIAAGALLLFGLARHWVAKTMALVVGLALAAACVIALIDGEDVLGLAATNGWTKLGLGAAAAVLLITALLPKVGKHDHEHVVERDEPVVEHHRTSRFDRDEESDPVATTRGPDGPTEVRRP